MVLKLLYQVKLTLWYVYVYIIGYILYVSISSCISFNVTMDAYDDTIAFDILVPPICIPMSMHAV